MHLSPFPNYGGTNKELGLFIIFCSLFLFGFRSLRPKQPRPYVQQPSSTAGIAANGNQAYNRTVGSTTHRVVPTMSGSAGVSRTYLNSSSYPATGSTAVTQMVSLIVIGC